MAKKKSKKQPDKVKITHARGRKRYLLVNGMISWGLATGLLFLTLRSWWQNGFSFSAWRAAVFSLQGMGILALFMSAGLVWGVVTWPMIEKKANRWADSRKKKQNQNEAVKPL